jgi:ribosomal protein L11
MQQDDVKTVRIPLKRYRTAERPLIGPKCAKYVSVPQVKQRIEEQFPPCSEKRMIGVVMNIKERDFTIFEDITTAKKITKCIQPCISTKEEFTIESGNYGQYRNRVKGCHPFVSHDGSISLSKVVQIAKENYQTRKTNAKSLSASVMQVLGTCVSVQCLVNGKNPKEIQSQIRNGELVVEDYLDETLYTNYR